MLSPPEQKVFKHIFLNENVWISIEISLKFAPRDPIDNTSALVQVMAWHLTGDKPLPEPMPIQFTDHICGTRGRWVELRVCVSDRKLQGSIFYETPLKIVVLCNIFGSFPIFVLVN